MSRPRKPPAFLAAANVRGSAKLAGLPSDSARLGFFYVVLGEAKLQPIPGLFASREHFRELAGRFARYLDAYIAQGILEGAGKLCARCSAAWGTPPRGALIVHDWHEHQYDPRKLERDRAYEARQAADQARNTDGNPDGNEAQSGGVSGGNPAEFPAPISRRRVREARDERERRTNGLEAEQGGTPEAPREAEDAEATEEEESWLHALSSPDR